MKTSELSELPVYFDRYIYKCDDVELLEGIRQSIDELDGLPLAKWRSIGDMTYAPGKWTIKDILQHLIDTERIFTYRALAFAREERQALPGYSEDEYGVTAHGSKRTLEDLVAELRATHQSVMAMYQSFTPAMLAQKGMGFKGEYSVAAIGFILPGHQRWHLDIIEERYYPLLFKL